MQGSQGGQELDSPHREFLAHLKQGDATHWRE